ncbi:hypothetical protein AWB76_03281 [Caballeronia temeraria]|uniref:Uncharacterized protein n=1 Tax=Caballeronia temeraria TaxID=1777137 RepID=A0A158AY17_9BURK|nr:hypothetical protein [Caballeronia temeraria]SAK62623.1 hypothetical protein AWB76_03281 [Caballeronia temeraria]
MYHPLYHGGNAVRNPAQEMYPAATLTVGDHLTQAAHKAPVAFSNTRLFDFSQKDGRRQAGLQQYLNRQVSNGTPLKTGDIIGACAIGAGSLLIGYAWGVENPADGVAFNIKTHFGGQLLENVNASSINSNGAMLKTPVWLKDNEIIDVELTNWPTTVPNDLRFWVTPILFVPQRGN